LPHRRASSLISRGCERRCPQRVRDHAFPAHRSSGGPVYCNSAIAAGSARASVHIEVRIECLDALDVDLGSLCLVKVDVEGFEASVLRGGINAIAADQPLIVLEQHESDF